jgi:hypothetical protein
VHLRLDGEVEGVLRRLAVGAVGSAVRLATGALPRRVGEVVEAVDAP